MILPTGTPPKVVQGPAGVTTSAIFAWSRLGAGPVELSET